jgi:site-specific DNA-methyltransferase (adenine-specific)
MSKTKLMLGDNLESLKKLPDNSIDSVVTDPPYGLSFMGKKWDYDVPTVEFWKEVWRVLKPGGHVLSFGGTRTYHRMVINIEDAGFEIRDQVMWLYGSGFPKSHNIGKAVDKIEGNEREVVGIKKHARDGDVSHQNWISKDYTHSVEVKNQGENMAKAMIQDRGYTKYEGWGTALKPANEPICVARKPLSEKTIAENVIKWGTGGINIDGCRIGTEVRTTPVGSNDDRDDKTLFGLNKTTHHKRVETTEGRFPANIILDETAAELLDEQSGFLKGDSPNRKPRKGGHREEYVGTDNNKVKNIIVVDKKFDSGGASRFFYQAKVSEKERNLGLDLFEGKEVIRQGLAGEHNNPIHKNTHPTLKPINLMTYLCRLVTPVGGIVLDPFMGSGSTGIAALLEGFKFCGMELDKDYFKISEARIESYEEYRKLLKKNNLIK